MTGLIQHGRDIFIGEISAKEIDMSYTLKIHKKKDHSIIIQDMRDGAYDELPSVNIPIQAMLPLATYLISQFQQYTHYQNQKIKDATSSL